MLCTVLWRTSRGTPGGREIWKFGEEFAGVPIRMVFILGNRVDALWADVNRDVTPSKSLLRQSTKRLKLARKSVPMIEIWTSVTTNRQVIYRRSPRLIVSATRRLVWVYRWQRKDLS
jgi:hypothetical protein